MNLLGGNQGPIGYSELLCCCTEYSQSDLLFAETIRAQRCVVADVHTYYVVFEISFVFLFIFGLLCSLVLLRLFALIIIFISNNRPLVVVG